MHNSGIELPLLGHIESLRKVLLGCLGLFIICCILVGCFFPFFAKALHYPLTSALKDSGNMGATQGLVTTSPMGIFSVLISVCFFGGLALSLPGMVYLMARFIAPGLTAREKRFITPVCLTILGLFLIGICFSYFFVLPVSLKAAIALNRIFGFEIIWSAADYYGLVVWMSLGIGLCFEFPLILCLLMYLNILSSSQLKRLRRHTILMVLILSALITPTGDPFTLAILAVPLYLLYEVSIYVGKRFEPLES